jgi:glycosyltransferase involved in cell wall biosynthesis
MPSSQPTPLRILHAPTNIAGQAGDVVAALRRLGHHAELWETKADRFGRPADRILDLDPDRPQATLDAIRDAADQFDVVHFHFGRTLVPARGVLPPYWDLPVLRGLGKRIFFTFHGSDVRVSGLHRAQNPWIAHYAASQEPDDDRTTKAVQVMRTYADGLFVASANNLVYVPDALYLPRVIDLAAWPACPPRDHDRPVIVHAPTRRTTKGTDLVLAALDDLAAEGLDFEVRLLEGVPHEEVRRTLANADILVDNVIAGSYGIVSLEAMASGMVAVANLSDPIREAHPDAPVVDVDPTTVRDALRRLIGDRDERRRIASLGRPWVSRVHDAEVVAGRLVEAYRAPARPATGRSMPDWMSMSRARKIEQLEARVDHLESELIGSRRREAELRARLGMPQDGPLPRRIARRVVPAGVRRWMASRVRGTRPPDRR